MKKIFLLLGALIQPLLINAQSAKWGFDPSHSKIRFNISHFVISETEGQFDKYEGTVLAEKPDFSDAKIDFTIDAASINTFDVKRDEHLRSADFFETAKYPKIMFKSKSIVSDGSKKFKLIGDLTMHGITKPVTLDVNYGGTVKDPFGNTKAGFKVTGIINRTDWGLKWNGALESGGMLVGENVQIICNLELIKL